LHKIAALREGLNGEYIANQVDHFIRKQTLKAALIEAGNRYQQGGPDLLQDVENILREGLPARGRSRLTHLQLACLILLLRRF
jgi:hypothetical protein